jgi:hypothetical protein
MPNRPGTRSRLLSPGRSAAVIALLACGVTLVFAYLDKARCTGAPFAPDGRSIAFDRIKDSHVCYSDIQFLWLGRDINEHVFPYLSGGVTPGGRLTGGAVEYPVLSGLLMWLGAVGVHNDAMFLLHSALLLAPFALATAWLLGRLSGMTALLWAAGSPLVLYAFHNWDLPVVCTAVAAVYVVTTLMRYSVRTRGIVAAVLLGVGFCLKVYPGIFVLPLLVHVLVGGSDGLAALHHRTGRRIERPGRSGAGNHACAVPFRRYDVAGGRRSRSRNCAGWISPRIPCGTGDSGRCSARASAVNGPSRRRSPPPHRCWCWPRSRSRYGWAGGVTRPVDYSSGSV